MKSCIYKGRLRHRRFSPVENTFEYPLFMTYTDLSELPAPYADRWFWSWRRFNIAWFRRRDYLGDPGVSLDAATRDMIEAQTGQRPSGPIRLLTQPRFFGFHFSPVNFYYCFDRSGEVIETILAEVRNGHFKDRRYYMLLDNNLNEGKDSIKRYRFTKPFHVSPFMEMDVHYDWGFGPASDRLAVQMESFRDGEKFFDATLRLDRQEITGWILARVLLSAPILTAHGIGLFSYQMLRLWLKRVILYSARFGTEQHMEP
jgi:uncharacterized protein